MDGQTPSGQTQSKNQPAQPPSNTQLIQPVDTTPAATAGITRWYKIIAQKLIANKSLALFLVMTILSAGMSTYIIMAPSSKTLPKPAAFSQVIPTSLPTAIPISSANPEPTAAPTLPPATPTEEVFPTETPTPTQTPTPTPDPTESWNTYINIDYGYTIKYPLNWSALDLGILEPKVPSYVAFNLNTASTSARSITISVSTRTHQEQLAINGTAGSPFYVASILGTWQNLRDSDGNTSVAVTLPRTNTILILRAKTGYVSTLNQMLLTLFLSE